MNESVVYFSIVPSESCQSPAALYKYSIKTRLVIFMKEELQHVFCVVVVDVFFAPVYAIPAMASILFFHTWYSAGSNSSSSSIVLCFFYREFSSTF